MEATFPPADDTDTWARLVETDTYVAGIISSILDAGQRLRADQRETLERSVEVLDEIEPLLVGPPQAHAHLLRELAEMALAL